MNKKNLNAEERKCVPLGAGMGVTKQSLIGESTRTYT